eukprot:m.91227 g.91227  ORF g.91227 m.91227 type:complete len:425 (-) comp8487_c1_seq7:1643-2917(-)
MVDLVPFIEFSLLVVPESVRKSLSSAPPDIIAALFPGRVGADGRGFADDYQTIGAFLRWFGSDTTALNEFPLFMIEGKESYELLARTVKSLFKSLVDIERHEFTDPTTQRTYRVLFHLLSDWVMEAELTGGDEAKAVYFCFMCDADKVSMRATIMIIGITCKCPIGVRHLPDCKDVVHFVLKSTDVIEELLRQPQGPDRKGVINPPLWPFGTLANRVFQDTLHWAMGITRTISDGLLQMTPPRARPEMIKLFADINVKLRWWMENDSKKIKRTKFLGTPLRRILSLLDVRAAHELAIPADAPGRDETIQRAVELWTLVDRLVTSLAMLPDEVGHIPPADFKFLADVAIMRIKDVYGVMFLAAYTHATTDHIAAQLEYLQALGFTLNMLNAQSIELRNQAGSSRVPRARPLACIGAVTSSGSSTQ